MEIAIVLILALLVFGPKRLPQAGRSLGQAMRELKKATTAARTDLGIDNIAADVKDLKSGLGVDEVATGVKDLKSSLTIDLKSADAPGQSAAAVAAATSAAVVDAPAAEETDLTDLAGPTTVAASSGAAAGEPVASAPSRRMFRKTSPEAAPTAPDASSVSPPAAPPRRMFRPTSPDATDAPADARETRADASRGAAPAESHLRRTFRKHLPDTSAGPEGGVSQSGILDTPVAEPDPQGPPRRMFRKSGADAVDRAASREV